MDMETLVREMNGAVILVTGEISLQMRLAMYSISEIYLDTQVKDGLNLNAFEFLACKAKMREFQTELAIPRTSNANNNSSGGGGSGSIGELGGGNSSSSSSGWSDGLIIISEFTGASRVLSGSL